MSEVSSTPAPTSGAGKSVAPNRAPEGGARKGPVDLFSNLLSLASSAPATAADTDALAQQSDDSAPGAMAGEAATQDPATAANPLAGLLGWIDQIMERGIRPSEPGQNLSPQVSKELKPAAPSGQALSQAVSAGKEQGVDITVMRPVDTQTTLSLPEELAAGPGRASRPPPLADGASVSVRQAQAPETSRAKGRTLSTQTSTIQAAMMRQSETSTDLRRTPRLSSTERSTVALDERFGRQQAVAASLPDDPSRPVLAASAAGSGPGDGASQGRTDFAAQAAGVESADRADVPEHFEPPGAETAQEAEPVTVSHWSTQHLRHASLRVGEGNQEAIDIQLSMNGQELNVDFRTDSAEARGLLSQQADQSLGSLLERSGIQLGGVSVGAQEQQPQGQQPRQTPSAATTSPGSTGTGQDSTPQAPGAAPRGQLAARQDSSRPLDLFV